VSSGTLLSSTSHTYCHNWCAQNPHGRLVGIEVYTNPFSLSVFCGCLFNEFTPSGIGVTSYIPAALYSSNNPWAGVGKVVSSAGSGGYVCYQVQQQKYCQILEYIVLKQNQVEMLVSVNF
jgi:hypothetical protein